MGTPNRNAKGEGSTYQANGRWYGTLTLSPVDGKRRRRTVSAKTEEKMLERLALLRAELADSDDWRRLLLDLITRFESMGVERQVTTELRRVLDK
jgi:hypothetical protein